jgi:hypothetical protein
MQTSALLAPFFIVASQNRIAAINWSNDCKDKIFDFTVRTSNSGVVKLNDALRPVFAPHPGAEVDVAISDFTSHPNAELISRSDGTVTFAHRPAITFYGLTWSESASVALLLIANQARTWNKKYRPLNPLPSRYKYDQMNLPRAIAALTYCWLETSVPAAFYGTYGSESAKLDYAKYGRVMLGPENLTESCNSGQALLKKARKYIKRIPSGREWGYSAFAHATLWLDNQHDDLHHYEAMGRESLKTLKKVVSIQTRNGSKRGNLAVPAAIDRKGQRTSTNSRKEIYFTNALNPTSCRASARGAQAAAMLLGPFATDPMHAYLLRSARRQKVC